MYLERIDIQGFKSFAIKSSLSFELGGQRSGISAIVGPNGSGKSNVADAMRWVLGEQSMKTLRGKKFEDVIFSGTDKKARLGFAEVSITLNNADGQAPIDYTELTITRRLYRSGESEYLINGAKARLQDILLILAKANVGQKSYSIIGQGMADAILAASPAERKEYFEEAAGVKQFQIKRDQSINKLHLSHENLVQADALLREIEPRLRSLTRQVKKLEKRDEVEKELKGIQQEYYGTLLHNLSGKITSLKKEVGIISEKRQNKEQELSAIKAKLANLEQEDTLSSTFLDLQNAFEELVKSRQTLRDREFELQQQIVRAERQQSPTPIGMSAIEIVSELEKLSQDIKTLNQAANATGAEVMKKVKGLVGDLLKSFDRLFNKVKPKKSESGPNGVADLKNKLSKLLTKKERLNKNIEVAQNKITDFNKQETQSKGAFFELQRAFQAKQQEVNILSSQENEQKIELARFETRQEDLEHEITNEGITITPEVKPVDNVEALIPAIQQQKRQLELIGGIDPEVVDEYESTKERFDFLTSQSTDLQAGIDSLEKAIAELDKTIKKQFDAAFKNINQHFQKYFSLLFAGGKASLTLLKPEEKTKELSDKEPDTDEEEFANLRPALKTKKKFSEYAGVEIKATPPGKRLQNINMLSGGERALTSIALISAIISNNPSPFVILDEVDASLDEANSERFADILDQLAHKTQFITITHNRATMAKATLLYGVTMGDDGVSKVLSLKLEDMAKEQ